MALRNSSYSEATKHEAHATLAGLAALLGEQVNPTAYDWGLPRDPWSVEIGEARYLSTRCHYEENDLLPWAYLMAYSNSPALIPAGIAMSRQSSVFHLERCCEKLCPELMIIL